MSDVILQTHLPYPVRRGKVRDVYDLGQELLIVATDRISAFDCIIPNGISGKGRLLTQLSLFWFDLTQTLVPNHIVATDVADFPQPLRSFGDQLQGRSVLVRKTKVVPIECVARGYLAGSAWKEYQRSQSVCGVKLPPDLKQCSRLPEPIFTPSTKADEGHDQNISFETMRESIDSNLADRLLELTLTLYRFAADRALNRGVIIADTKFEFGQLPSGELIVIDEMLTPDSSRFWPADQYAPGGDQPSFDKQFVRNWLEKQAWDKAPPAPALPDDVIEGTRRRYVEAYELLTGKPWRG